MSTEAGEEATLLQRVARADARSRIHGFGGVIVRSDEDPSTLAWVAGPLQPRWAFGPLR